MPATVDEIAESTDAAGDLLMGQIIAAAGDGVLMQSQSEWTCVTFVWGLILFSAMNNWEVLMVFSITLIAETYIDLWV